MTPAWIVMPVLNCWDYTRQAIEDCLAQTGVDARVLVVNNGSTSEVRAALEARMEQTDSRVLCFHHDPPLPSLSATWNRALRFVWGVGGTEALVVNNDVRLHKDTYRILATTLFYQKALFVTAVGVREEQFDPTVVYDERDESFKVPQQHGGPDFSCFLISQACHAKYPFDELFIPAYREDCSYHREMMLGGDGGRIFSVNLPYLHYASRTVNQFTPEQQAAFAKRSEQSRRHYVETWGGDVNHERFTRKGDPSSAREGVTNPELQARVQAGVVSADAVLGDVPYIEDRVYHADQSV